MKHGYKFLEILFSTNRSDEKGTIQKLHGVLDGVPGTTFVTGYDNGAKFLINTSRTEEVISAIGRAGFAIIQVDTLEDTKSLLAIIAPGVTGSFQEIDEHRIAKMWE